MNAIFGLGSGGGGGVVVVLILTNSFRRLYEKMIALALFSPLSFEENYAFGGKCVNNTWNNCS